MNPISDSCILLFISFSWGPVISELSVCKEPEILNVVIKVATHVWFVCPTVSMGTTSHATGLEKTLFLPFPAVTK